MNPYKVLGVSMSDSDDRIRQKYRQLSKRYHPDVYAGNNKDFALKMMQDINQAYEQIMSERKSNQRTSTTDDDAADFWTVWAAWAQAYQTQTNQQTGKSTRSTKDTTKRTAKTNSNAYFRRAHDGAGSYKVKGSDRKWSRVLLNLDDEELAALFRDIRFDIFETLKKYNGAYDGIFSKGIYHRILSYAAAEYIDPIDCIKKTLKVDHVDGCELTLVFDSYQYIDTLGLMAGDMLILDFDAKKHKDPYAVSIYTERGVYLGSNESGLANYISILHATGEASFVARISSFDVCKRYDRATRTYFDNPAITVSIQISFPNELMTKRLLLDNHQKIENLLEIYSKYVQYTDEYFGKNIFSTNEAVAFLEKTFVCINSNFSEYELCYHLMFPVDGTRKDGLTYQQVTRLSTYAPIYYENFDADSRTMLFNICNACFDGGAVNTFVSRGKHTLLAETPKYQFVVTLNKQPKGHIAVGVYMYSKRKFFFLHTAEQQYRKQSQ